MKRALQLIILCSAVSGCAKIERAWSDREARAEASRAVAHENPDPQPICASYIVHLPDNSSKEMTACYSGDGRARFIWAGNAPPDSSLIVIPPFFSAKAATAYGARCVGDGILKGHEYHRWVAAVGPNSAEVWIDDDGAFPAYFRCTTNATDTLTYTEWNLQNSWVDQTLKDKENFFDTVPSSGSSRI